MSRCPAHRSVAASAAVPNNSNDVIATKTDFRSRAIGISSSCVPRRQAFPRLLFPSIGHKDLALSTILSTIFSVIGTNKVYSSCATTAEIAGAQIS